MASKRTGPCRGFTMLEVIAVIIILGILSAVIYGTQGALDTELAARAGVLRNHIRYAQLRAMKGGALYGLACQGTNYWLFVTSPSDTSKRVALPGETDTAVHLAGTNVTLTEFTLFFDAAGRPYTAYTSSSSNTPVTDLSPLNLVMAKDSSNVTLAVSPETGFVP